MSFRVALCQIDTVPGDVPGNAARIRAAAADRARVEVAPARVPEEREFSS
jgi:predicted amidohydrolase